MEAQRGGRRQKRKKAPLWLKVTGIGCGAILLIAIVLTAGSIFFVRDALQDFEVSDRALANLADQHGSIADYRPDPDGSRPLSPTPTVQDVRTAESTRSPVL